MVVRCSNCVGSCASAWGACRFKRGAVARPPMKAARETGSERDGGAVAVDLREKSGMPIAGVDRADEGRSAIGSELAPVSFCRASAWTLDRVSSRGSACGEDKEGSSTSRLA